MATPSNPIELVLASGSPRRRELLERLGLSFAVRTPEVDEQVRPDEAPRAYVERLAKEKAAAVARAYPAAVVLAADTTVVLGEQILGKPQTDDQAKEMIGALAGRAHTVLSGVAIDGRRRASLVVETAVRFRSLTRAEIDWYVGTGEGRDKAGGYAVQGLGAALVASVDGSPTNVIGLPLVESLELLSAAGLPLPWSGP